MDDDDARSDVDAQHRERFADAREHALDARESRLNDQESRQIERKDEVDNVLAKAAQRDEVADVRDSAAGKRDRAANMHAWLHGNNGRAEAEARQEALDDRLHSEGNRKSSAVDRSILAGDDDPGRSGPSPT